MLKRLFGTLTAALILSGVSLSTAAPEAQAQAMCSSVRVSSSYAYLKTGPALGYKTARLAYRGEALTPTGAAPRGGWHQVRTGQGQTYWVHQSVVRCASGSFGKSCANVNVTGPQGAYMKAYPTLSSRTYRVAPRGEVLALVSPGNPVEYNGWFLVRSRAGYRYWAHNSVLGCAN